MRSACHVSRALCSCGARPRALGSGRTAPFQSVVCNPTRALPSMYKPRHLLIFDFRTLFASPTCSPPSRTWARTRGWRAWARPRATSPRRRSSGTCASSSPRVSCLGTRSSCSCARRWRADRRHRSAGQAMARRPMWMPAAVWTALAAAGAVAAAAVAKATGGLRHGITRRVSGGVTPPCSPPVPRPCRRCRHRCRRAQGCRPDLGPTPFARYVRRASAARTSQRNRARAAPYASTGMGVRKKRRACSALSMSKRQRSRSPVM